MTRPILWQVPCLILIFASGELSMLQLRVSVRVEISQRQTKHAAQYFHDVKDVYFVVRRC